MGDEQEIKALLHHFISRLDEKNTGRTILVKLLYLTDKKAYHELGRTLTNLPYKYDRYGPFNSQILDCLEDLVDEGYVRRRKNEWDNNVAYRYSVMNLRSCPYTLTNQEESLADSVLEELEEKMLTSDLDRLLDYVYSEEPMASTNPGQLIEF